MSILPIDIQTIIGQMNNVSKVQHNAEHSPLTQQQHFGNTIHDKSVQHDRQVNDMLKNENEDKIVKGDQEKRESSEQKKRSPEQKKKAEEQKQNEVFFKDPDKGNLIDIKK